MTLALGKRFQPPYQARRTGLSSQGRTGEAGIKLIPNPILGTALLILAGCTQAYDRDALPDASTTLHQATTHCEMEQTALARKNYSQFTACQLAAERDFAHAIHLVKMEAFETYAAQMMALAADRDGGLVSLDDVKTRAGLIRRDYWAACACILTGRRLARNGPYYGSDIGTYYNGGDPGPAVIGGAVWNGR